MTQTENGNTDWQVQLKWEPISAIHLLKKQLKRYQSLIEKIDDLCKRMVSFHTRMNCFAIYFEVEISSFYKHMTRLSCLHLAQ